MILIDLRLDRRDRIDLITGVVFGISATLILWALGVW